MLDAADGGLLWLGATLLLLSVALWLIARRGRRTVGLPTGRILYADHGTWFRQEEPFYSSSLHLVGKPDYLVEEAPGIIVPVELKSGAAPAEPYESHVLQLAAYCYLVDEELGVRPKYGILQYADRAFAVDYTEALEDALLVILEEMREVGSTDELDRDHDQPGRCAGCGVRRHCDQRLA